MPKQSFLKGTLIILAAGLITRILGFVYRILLSRIIGAEGMGLYQMAYPTITVAITLVTGGLPIAIAKLVAEAEAQKQEQRIRYILQVSTLIVMGLSVLGMMTMVAAAPLMAEQLLKDARTYTVMMAMIPVLPIVALSSVFRGYFQGRQNMTPSALGQVAEQCVRIALTVYLSMRLIPYGVEYAAAGAMAGMVGGELIGLCVLFLHYRAHQQRPVQQASLTFQERRLTINAISKVAIPITASKMVGTLSYFFEPIVVAQSLFIAGFSAAAATSLYGELAGMAIPLVLFPTVLTYALSVSLVPAISEAAAQNNRARIQARLHQSMRISLLTGAPFCVLMTMLAEPISALVYGEPKVGRLVQMMAPFTLFLYYQGPLNAALQGLGQARTAMVNSIAGALIKLVAIFLLGSQSRLGIEGVAAAIVLSFVSVTLLHMISIARKVGWMMEWQDFSRVALGVFGMSVVLFLLSLRTIGMPSVIQLTFSAGISLWVYLTILLSTGMLSREDLARLPWIGNWFTR